MIRAQAAPRSLETELLEATKSGDPTRIRALVARHPSRAALNAALHEAAFGLGVKSGPHQWVEVAKLLLDAGADNKQNALETAVQFGRAEMVRFLLDKGANAKAVRSDGWTLLMTAQWDQFEIMSVAAQRQQIAVTQMLIEAGADVNARTESGETVLMQTQSGGVAQVLIAHGADVNALDKRNDSALTRAARNGYVSTARVLLEHGADAKRKGETALYVSTRYANLEMMRLLLKNGVASDARDEKGDTALMQLAEVYPPWSGHEEERDDVLEAVKLLLKNGADINAKSRWGETVLMLAVANWETGAFWASLENEQADSTLVQLLLRHGADPNAQDRRGNTALMWLLSEFSSDSGRNPQSRGPAPERIREPMLLAMTQFLLSHGADPHLRGDNGNTPLKWARLRHRPKIAALLQSW